MEAGGPDGELSVPVSLLPGGYPFVDWRAFRPAENVEYSLRYQTGSWIPGDPEATYATDDFVIGRSGDFGTIRLEDVDWPDGEDISEPGP